MIPDERKYTSPGVRQSLKILSWISRVPQGVGFNELREKVYNIPPSTLTRHLKILAEENWVIKNSAGLYQPGAAYICAVTNVTGKPNPDGLIRPVLDKLAKESGHSAAFSEWDRGGICFRLKKDMPGSFHYPPSQNIIRDVFSHPFGLTALAYLSPSVRQWNIETRVSEIPLPEDKLTNLLQQIKEEGVYVGHRACDRVCAPVLYSSGDLAGVIGLSVLGSGAPWRERVKEAAREIEGLNL